MSSNFLIFFTYTQLYKQRVHLGMFKPQLNPLALRYVLPIKSRFSLINLHFTSTLLKTSFNYMLSLLSQRGSVLVVNESKLLVPFLKAEFNSIGQPVSYSGWAPGLLSNFKAVRRGSLKTYFLKKQFILKLFKLDALGLLNSKIRNIIKSSFNFLKFKKELGRYIQYLNRMPNAVFVFDTLLSEITLLEARKVGIVSLGLTDTNASTFLLNYGIPSNSNSFQSLVLYFKLLKLIFIKGSLLERRNFLKKSLARKRFFLGLNFLLARSTPLSHKGFGRFASFYLQKGAILNPYINMYVPRDLAYVSRRDSISGFLPTISLFKKARTVSQYFLQQNLSSLGPFKVPELDYLAVKSTAKVSSFFSDRLLQILVFLQESCDNLSIAEVLLPLFGKNTALVTPPHSRSAFLLHSFGAAPSPQSAGVNINKTRVFSVLLKYQKMLKH